MKQPPLLRIKIVGKGPDVVLLHGFLSSSEYWKEVSAIISRHHRVITVDLLGFGESPKPRGSAYDYDAHLASLHRTLNHHGITQYVLVGHSMGALLALRYATLYSQHMMRLILVNMPITLSKKQAKHEYLSTDIMYRIGLTPIVHNFTWAGLRGLYAAKLLPKRTLKTLTDNDKLIFRHTATSRIRSFYNVIVNAHVDKDLAGVSVDTLLLMGTKDRRVYMDNLTNHITLSSHITLEQVEVGHHIPQDTPELIDQKLRNSLADR